MGSKGEGPGYFDGGEEEGDGDGEGRCGEVVMLVRTVVEVAVMVMDVGMMVVWRWWL